MRKLLQKHVRSLSKNNTNPIQYDNIDNQDGIKYSEMMAIGNPSHDMDRMGILKLTAETNIDTLYQQNYTDRSSGDKDISR